MGDPVLKKPDGRVGTLWRLIRIEPEIVQCAEANGVCVGIFGKALNSFQVIALGIWFEIHGSLLNPVLPTVSVVRGKPGWFGGA